MASIETRLTSRLGVIARQAEEKADALVKKAMLDIEGGAKVRSRVDTGQMKNGWHSVDHGTADGEVRNGVEHAIYNEFGTRHMSAQPMLHPSVEDARPAFEAGVRSLYE